MNIARYVLRHTKLRLCLKTLACVRLRLLQSRNHQSILYRSLSMHSNFIDNQTQNFGLVNKFH